MSVYLNFGKEEAQVMHIIDRFFGTVNGATTVTLVETDTNGKTRTTTKVDDTIPNVVAEMRRLRLLLCGGAINSIFTGAEVNDLDFYMINNSNQKKVEDFFKRHFKDEMFESSNALTFKRRSKRHVYTAQLITRFTGHAHEIFNWFDFTITHCAYDFDNCKFEFGNRFFQDVSKKRLVYSGASKYPICAMYRTKKYMDRGYNLSGATIMHIALSIVQLKINNYKELKDQLLGIDTSYLTKLLDRYNPENPVDYGEFIYEAFQLVDRINGYTAAEEEDEAHNG